MAFRALNPIYIIFAAQIQLQNLSQKLSKYSNKWIIYVFKQIEKQGIERYIYNLKVGKKKREGDDYRHVPHLQST